MVLLLALACLAPSAPSDTGRSVTQEVSRPDTGRPPMQRVSRPDTGRPPAGHSRLPLHSSRAVAPEAVSVVTP